MIREEIIKVLNVEPKTNDLYNKLEATLCTCDAVNIEPWFKCVIDSLYYKPNKNVLILQSDQAVGKTHWFKNLWYNPYRFKSTNELLVDDLYEYIIIDFNFEKRQLNTPRKDFFKIDMIDELPISNKRLSSFCGTTNDWKYPQRKNFIIVPVEKIDHELYNSIDKRLLWIEIFNKFKS